jgi:GGDEF domain-containing protein
LSQLSEDQTIAVAPLVRALSSLISGYEETREREGKEEGHGPALFQQSHTVSAVCLDALEQNLSHALELDDAEAIKKLISTCLEVVRADKANASAPTLTVPPAPPTSVDGETGLPGRLLFERLVADSIVEGRKFITALFVVERLPLINKRFGRAAGDRVLLHVAQYLGQELPDSNSLSRWSGPAFSAIINCDNSDKMESQIRAISNKPLSANIDVGNRSVMLTISCACMMEQVNADASPESLFTKMDNFVTARTGGRG